MSNQEKLNITTVENNSVIGSSIDLMAENVRNILHGIRNSVRGLIRNVALVSQLSVAAFGAIGCETSPGAEGHQDDTPQCVSTIPAEPQVKEVAVCFMRWSEADELTDKVRARLEAQFDWTTQFYKEVTFGRDFYEFKFIDSGTVWAGPEPKWEDDGINFAVTACAPQIGDFSQLSAFVMFPTPPSSVGGNRAYATSTTVPTPQGNKEMEVIGLPHFDFSQLPHELGHANLHLNHATLLYCHDGDKAVTYMTDPMKCHTDVYGNTYDVMGAGLITGPYKRIFGHPGGFEKSLNGLVKVTNVTENSGEYPLAALEPPCNNLPRLIRIPYKKRPLCLEHRKPIGFDALPSKDDTLEGAGALDHILPPGGCVLLQICSNDPTTFGYRNLDAPYDGVTFLLQVNNFYDYPHDMSSTTCISPDGFHDSELGIDVSYRQSTTNPNAVIVNVSGVDETRLAKLPNIKIEAEFQGDVIVKNVSENGESVGTFKIQISGKRISDGKYELIETRTIDGLNLFDKVTIKFPPNQLVSLRLIYSEWRVTADSGNVIEETDETDNQATFEL